MSTIMRKVNILSRAEGVFRTDRLKGSSLNACHHSYILAVTGHPGMSQDELARHICTNKSGVTRHLAYLEEHGYVSRVPSEHDRRVMLVYPTEKAKEVLPEVVDIVKEWDSFLKSAFTAEEAEMLDALLRRAADKAGDYIERRQTTVENDT